MATTRRATDRDPRTGRFVRKAVNNSQSVPPQETNQLLPIHRAALTGVLPGHWGSDHLRELESNKGWTYQAVHTVATLYAAASPSVSVKPANVTKGFSTAQDAPDEQWKQDTNHPAYKLLCKPNKFVSGMMLRYQMAQQIRLTGGCLIWEVKNVFGKPVELWVIPRAWAYYQMPTREKPLGYYRVTPYRNYWTQLYAWPFGMSSYDVDVRETALIGNPDPLLPGECTSPLAANDKIIDTSNMTETAVWASMLNGVKPSLAFSIDPRSGVVPSETEMAAFLQKIDELKAGPHNAGKILAMIGLGVQQLNMNPNDLMAVDSRNQNQEFVMNVHGVTPTATGKAEQTSYSAAAVAMNTLAEVTIQPGLDMVADRLTHRWQPYWGEEAGGEEFKVSLDAKRYDDPTLDQQWADKKAAGYEGGYVTGNEVRAALKLEPMDGLDELKKPEQPPMAPGMDPNAQQQPGAPTEDDPLAMFDIDDENDDYDLENDAGDDSASGIRIPELQKASGNRMPSLNGKH